jgi:uncharacterized damage-inducible protein DinB
MSTATLLTTLLRHKAWADDGLIAGLAAIGDDASSDEFDELDTALRLLHHAHIVDRIFVAHMQRVGHGYRATEADETPPPEALFDAIRQTDRWLVDYAARLDELDPEEPIAFRFTDGTAGTMSRAEMLAHLVAHGGYHRGEIGRILTRLTGSSPRDTLTGYLHEAEPARREHAA